MHLNGDTVASVPTNKVNPKTGMSQMGKGKDTAGTCHQDHASIYTTEQHRHQSQHPIQPLHQHGVEKQSIHNTIHTSSVEGGGCPHRHPWQHDADLTSRTPMHPPSCTQHWGLPAQWVLVQGTGGWSVSRTKNKTGRTLHKTRTSGIQM